jgi:hypothetical protein
MRLCVKQPSRSAAKSMTSSWKVSMRRLESAAIRRLTISRQARSADSMPIRDAKSAERLSRYHFIIHNACCRHDPDEGTELPDDAAARQEAVQVIRDFKRITKTGGKGGPWRRRRATGASGKSLFSRGRLKRLRSLFALGRTLVSLLGHLQPRLRYEKPNRLVPWTDRLFGLLPTLLSLVAKLVGGAQVVRLCFSPPQLAA